MYPGLCKILAEFRVDTLSFVSVRSIISLDEALWVQGAYEGMVLTRGAFKMNHSFC